MNEINLSALSEAISNQLKTSVELVSIEKAGSGFHATGFKLTTSDGRSFFIKKITINSDGFEFPERKLSALVLSHNMNLRAGVKPASLGVILEHEGTAFSLSQISSETNIYHIQEFGVLGANYFSLLNEDLDKKEVDEKDVARIQNIVDAIGSVHSITPTAVDEKHLGAMYMDSLRAELVHPELTVTLMHALDEEHPILPRAKQGEFIALYLKVIHDWKGRYNRTRALHGDFWGANVLVQEDATVSLIDFSRIPWGDPGIDIGRWIAQYVWLYIVTQNSYFKELGELFLTTYEKRTGDTEIQSALTTGYIFPILVYATMFTDTKEEIRKQMFDHGCAVLEKGEFFWPS